MNTIKFNKVNKNIILIKLISNSINFKIKQLLYIQLG